MQIKAKDARNKLSSLLDLVEEGEEIIITRRGKKIARLVSQVGKVKKRLPTLVDFRSSIHVTGEPLSTTVINVRKEERY